MEYSRTSLRISLKIKFIAIKSFVSIQTVYLEGVDSKINIGGAVKSLGIVTTHVPK